MPELMGAYVRHEFCVMVFTDYAETVFVMVGVLLLMHAPMLGPEAHPLMLVL